MHIKTLLAPFAKRRLSKTIEEVLPVLQSERGAEELVRCVASQEAIFKASEYVFEVIGTTIVSNRQQITKERLELVCDCLLNGITQKIPELLDIIHSTQLPECNKKSTFFHVHSRVPYVDYIASGCRGFSARDYQVAKRIPIGLVEYCQEDSDTTGINLVSRFSLCYRWQSRIFLNAGIQLKHEGTYIVDFGDIKFSGHIPLVLHFPSKVHDMFLNKFPEDELVNYMIQHSVERV